jgi:hypothetical protein
MPATRPFLAACSISALALALPWMLAGCVAATGAKAPAVAPVAGAEKIDEIELERDCFGCETGSRLVLHRDGRAVLTLTGKPRRGTQDRQLHGQLSAQDFDILAREVLAQGFFALAPIYDLPDLRDGAWATLRVTRAGERTEVFRREDAGPPALHRLEAAVEAVQARIRFEERPLR